MVLACAPRKYAVITGTGEDVTSHSGREPGRSGKREGWVGQVEAVQLKLDAVKGPPCGRKAVLRRRCLSVFAIGGAIVAGPETPPCVRIK